MPRDLVELKNQVKAASDILDVISNYLPVHTNGKIHKSICPFHNDTRPSMQIDRKFQNFHCWACGAKGDVFSFIEKYEKVGFKEALAILARRANIALEEASPQDHHKIQLFEVMRWAQAEYQTCLLESEVALAARKYIGSRHLSGPTVRQFGIGFAPIDGDWLTKQANQQGISTDLLEEVGLIAKRDENRGFYDRFRDRVMFPIRDVQSRTVGFGGRILPDSPYAARGPKYYNSSDTPLFSKSDLIFGIDHARHAGATAGFLAVVEGYTDVMMAHQSGIPNIVAAMGTALNARHVAQLRRYANKVVLLFDADEGGNTGVDRALEIFISHDVELAIATLPEGLDPADLLSKPDGKAIFENVLKNAVDALDFKLNQLFAKNPNPNIETTRRMLDAILGVIAMAPNVPNQSAQLKQELILTRLSHRMGIELKVVRSRVKELQVERRKQEQRNASRAIPVMPAAARILTPETPEIVGKPSGSAPVLERQLLQILLAEPGLVPDAKDHAPAELVSHSGLKRMLIELYALHDIGIPPDLDGLRVRLLDRPDLASVAMDLQQVGRGIPDRQLYFKKVIAGFGKQRVDADTKSVKDQLNAVGTDDAAAIELLRRLQNRDQPKK